MKKLIISFLIAISFGANLTFSMESTEEKKFGLFKDLPVELKQYIINIYLTEEFAQERDIENLIKKILELRAQIKEINNVVTQKSFWDNIFENFFYNLLHIDTKASQVNEQLRKSTELIKSSYGKLMKSHYENGKTPLNFDFCLNLVIPALASKIYRINLSRKVDLNEKLKTEDRIINELNDYIYSCEDEKIKKFIEEIKYKVGKLWHPYLILFLSDDYKILSLKALIDAGANINVQDEFSRTPLYIASDYGIVGAVKILLEAGADTKIVNHKGRTALEVAKNGKIAQMLKEVMAKK